MKFKLDERHEVNCIVIGVVVLFLATVAFILQPIDTIWILLAALLLEGYAGVSYCLCYARLEVEENSFIIKTIRKTYELPFAICAGFERCTYPHSPTALIECYEILTHRTDMPKRYRRIASNEFNKLIKSRYFDGKLTPRKTVKE